MQKRLSIKERRRDKRKRTAIYWMHKKGLIPDNEYLTGNALALLIEWRASSFAPASSHQTFARSMNERPVRQWWPYERSRLVVDPGKRYDKKHKQGGRVIELDEFRLPNPRTAKRNGVVLHNELIKERLQRFTCAYHELRRVADLIERALPERPDLLVVLCHAVTERISVREIPHHDVEVLAAALCVIKELWRMDLLEDLIDDANGTLVPTYFRAGRSGRDKKGASASDRCARPCQLSETPSIDTASSRDRDREARTADRPLSRSQLTRGVNSSHHTCAQNNEETA